MIFNIFFFFFSSRRRHTRLTCDWSSDVCSSDLGGVVGEPFEVLQSPVTGLPLPANAEIIIEGTAYPDRKLDEGPFGEWTGYYASDVRPEPTITVERVLHRANPIMLGSPPGKPPSE